MKEVVLDNDSDSGRIPQTGWEGEGDVRHVINNASCVPQMQSSPNAPGLPMPLLQPALSVSDFFLFL